VVPPETASASAPPVALVELFTSEGCSSCPPADRLLGELVDSSDRRIYALAFHVDYWDDLGWPDPFASSTYTARQQTYARAFASREMYTPQMIVNGTEGFTGSDRDRAETAIHEALSQPSTLRLDLHPRWTAAGALTVDYEVSEAPPAASLVVALVEHRTLTHVLRGENAGRTLRHENVVRSLATASLEVARGSVTVDLPRALPYPGAELIAWAQRGPSIAAGLPVLGAARSPLPTR
jgi:hypothetical protein